MNYIAYYIDLDEYVEGMQVLSDSYLGIDAVRYFDLEYKVNHLDSSEKIKIIIPPYIKSINPSFLEEFIRPIYDKLGRWAFNNKVIIECQGKYNIGLDLDESIYRLLDEYQTSKIEPIDNSYNINPLKRFFKNLFK